jgi:hypothetical protein
MRRNRKVALSNLAVRADITKCRVQNSDYVNRVPASVDGYVGRDLSSVATGNTRVTAVAGGSVGGCSNGQDNTNRDD